MTTNTSVARNTSRSPQMTSAATNGMSTKDYRVEILSRIVASVILVFTTWKVGSAFADSPNITLLLALVGEVLTLGLVIFARMPKSMNSSPFIFVIAMSSSLYFFVINLSTDGTSQLAPIFLVAMLQLMGIAIQVASKLWLGRSFGVLPADRGIVTDGPYRMVRHPIYFGYFLNHLGFCLFHFSLWNVLVYTGVYAVQVTRIMYEERILMQSSEYVAYATVVRRRLIPFVF